MPVIAPSHPPVLGRRNAIRRATCLAAAALWAPAASASAWPVQPVRVLVPFPAGGHADRMVRVVTRSMGQALETPFVVDNRPGAAGQLMYQLLRQAPADGHTIGYMSTSTAILQVTHAGLPFNVRDDLLPLALIGAFSGFLVASASAPGRTLAELIDHARLHPGALSYGSFGQGSQTHLQMARMLSMVGASMVHVPYQGEAPVMRALVSGEVQFAIVATYPGGLVDDGKIRVLATSAPRRLPRHPQVPTLAEAGFLMLQTTPAWAGLCTSAPVPLHIARRISQASIQACALPEVKAQLESMGYTVVGGGMASARAALEDDLHYYADAARAAGLSFR